MPPYEIDVRRLEANYRVARGSGDAASVERRLNRVATDSLARSWERHADAFGEDGAYHFVERVTVNLSLDIAGGDDSLARAWSAALHGAVLRAVAAGGAGVTSFRDRGEYL